MAEADENEKQTNKTTEFTHFAMEYIARQRKAIQENKVIDMHCALLVDHKDIRCCVGFANDIGPDDIMARHMPTLSKTAKWLALTRDSFYCPPEHSKEWFEQGQPPLKTWSNAKELLLINVESEDGGIECMVKYSRDADGVPVLEDNSTQIQPYGAHRGLHWFGRDPPSEEELLAEFAASSDSSEA